MESSDSVYVPKNHFDRLSSFSADKDDILLSVVGTLGNASIVTEDDIPAIFSCKSTIIRTSTLDPWYLISYLNSHIGQMLLSRRTRGSVQTGLNLLDIQSIRVPRLTGDLESKIGEMARVSYKLRKRSVVELEKAEHTLLQALGLEDWEPPEPLTYVKSFSDVFSSNRLDSQFFRPQYDALYERLSSVPPVETVESYGKVLKGKTVPYYEDGNIPIIRSGDLTNLDSSDQLLHSKSSEPIFYLENGDVLISSIGFGSIGKIQVFDKKNLHGTVSEVTVIRQKIINPYYLMFFLRSLVGQIQIDRYITGATGQLHLYPRDVGKILIPVLKKDQQLEYEIMHRKVSQARKKSSLLLEDAKRAVEIAIESGEDAAFAYLENIPGE